MERTQRYALAAVVACVTFLVYLGALGNDFVSWDDPDYVQKNYHIRSLDLSFLRWAVTTFYASNWHPLTWISHALDYALWGLEPAGHHLTNILLHAANTFLVVFLCMRLHDAWRKRAVPDIDQDNRYRQHALSTGVVTGLLFGLHPMHVESVAWISERKDLLCGLFYLLSLLSYMSFAESRAGASPQAYARSFKELLQTRVYLLSVAWCGCALMSKPMAVSLPVVLLVLDWYPLKRISSLASFRNAVLEKLPFIAQSAIVSVLTIIAQRASGAMELMTIIPLWGRVLVAGKALIVYLGHMAFPLNLSPFYPYPKPSEIAALPASDVIGALLAVSLVVAAYRVLKEKRAVAAAALFYLVTVFPALGILQVGSQSMADRYMYLPSIGPFFIAGSVAAWGWDRFSLRDPSGLRARRVLAAVLASVVLALSCMTVRQTAVWKNGITLWSDVIDRSDGGIAFAYLNRGLIYTEQGKHDLALSDYDKAIALDPRYAMAYSDRGVLYEKMGQRDRALQDFDTAISINPSIASAYRNRGAVLAEMGLVDRAIEDYSSAIRIDPAQPSAYSGRGTMYAKQGNYDRALGDLTQALALRPDHADDLIRRGRMFKELGRYDRALDDYTAAIAVAPANADAFNGRSIVYKHLEQYDRALSDLDRAIALSPSLYLAYCNRAVIFEKMGRDKQAIGDYSKAVSLMPDIAQIYVERARLYLKTAQRTQAAHDYQRACSLGSASGCNALRSLR